MQKQNKDLPHRIFAYGTLKYGQPNHFHMLSNEHGQYKFIASAKTDHKFPLIIATHWNLPFLLHAEGKGHVSL